MFIDAKGKPCPQPVILAIRALNALQAGETLQVQVDNEAAVENLKRMVQKKGAAADVKADGSCWIVEIVPAGAPAAQSGAGLSGAVATGGAQSGAALSGAVTTGGAQSGAALSGGAQSSLSAEEQAQQICAVPARGPVVVAIGSAEMGNGDPKLGKILMKSFLYSLTQLDALPQTVLFFNGGVRMTTEGSESIEDLKALEAQGVEILSCGTCLDFYGLKDKLRVGGITNMYVIAQTMAEAGNVVKI
ncbi:MAG: sulfurtransferase-like selenium metabolism protein YedF [Lachnospiraceae bacterium]|nr:sulfurtransferase-like selenium metabolism protein YedF [Lachnospiraceae bacterium]